MTLNRQPRLQTPLPTTVVKIPAPPNIPSKPENSNLISVLLPLGAVLLSVILMISLMGGASSGLSYLLFLPIMLVSYLVAYITSRGIKKNYEKKLVEGREVFRANLRDIEEELKTFNKQEKIIRLSVDQDPGECIRMLQKTDARIGERRPGDQDFLYLRLGLGEDNVYYHIEENAEEKREEFEQEYEFIAQLIQKYSKVEEVPIQARIPVVGSFGISGNRNEVIGVCNALLLQLMVNHWPTEVNIASVSRIMVREEWKWLEGSVYTNASLVTKDGNQKQNPNLPDAKFLSKLEKELQKREQQIAMQQLMKKENEQSPFIPMPRIFVVFDYLPKDFHHPAVSLLLKKGPSLGVYGIFLSENSYDIPGDCGAVLALKNGKIDYKESGSEGYVRSCIADVIPSTQMHTVRSALENIKWPSDEDQSSPPDVITFLEMYGAKSVDDLPIDKWWDETPPYGYLRAPIGRMSSTSDMIFDLNEDDNAHGPHGLLGGMTGSGKSEVLKAIILSLAVTHHPYDLNFALIDFKGGAAFNELAKLPHTVGVVTDIESNATFAERVIQALSGEIERRKKLLEEARAVFNFGRSHVDEYRKQPVRLPLPRLMIVFDEFAEFKQRNPVESKKLISIARQGRSLGVHLLLATQNIEAAVDPEIMQNSSFRICLKVAEPQDSMQMVGIPDAVSLPRGRAYFSSNNRMLYQSAFSGANYIPKSGQILNNEFVKIWPDGRREKLDLPRRKTKRDPENNIATEASAVVAHLVKKAQEMHIKKPPAVWPDALPEEYALPKLVDENVSGGWDGKKWSPCIALGENKKVINPAYPFLGLQDLPGEQIQKPLQIQGNQGGNLLIFGSSGSGKSTLLRTMITSLALTQSPDMVNIYVIDYGGQSSLKLLEAFPHVGGVVTRLEIERTERLVQLIHSEVNRRNDLLRAARVDHWKDYNSQVKENDQLPALYLFIDNFRDFKQTFEHEFIEQVSSLISGGQSAGLYLILATSLQGDIPNDIFANINMRITFAQADQTEYFRIIGTPSEAKIQEDLEKGIRPGRGLLRGTPPIEFQAALPTVGDSDRELAQNLRMLSENMNNAWIGKRPKEVLTLPNLVSMPEMANLKLEKPFTTVLGLDFESLQPVGFSLVNDGPAFLIGSTMNQCGKTTLLRGWLLGLAESYSPKELQVILIDFHTRTMAALRTLPIIQTYVGSKSALDDTLDKLMLEIEKREKIIEKEYEKDPDCFDIQNVLSKWPHISVFIDDYERLYQSFGNEIYQLAECIRRSEEIGISFVISGKIRDFPYSHSDRFIERFRKTGCGILLGGVEGIDEYNDTRRPVGSVPSGLVSGRGYMIQRGNARLIQTVAFWKKDQPTDEALRDRINRIAKK